MLRFFQRTDYLILSALSLAVLVVGGAMIATSLDADPADVAMAVIVFALLVGIGLTVWALWRPSKPQATAAPPLPMLAASSVTTKAPPPARLTPARMTPTMRDMINGLVLGLGPQGLGLVPGLHYQLTVKDAPRVGIVRLENAPPQVLKRVKERREELSMFAGLPGDEGLRITRDRLAITIEIPKPIQDWTPVTIEGLQNRGAFTDNVTSTLGVDLYNEPISIAFDDNVACHALIAGMSGSGKTIAQQTSAFASVYDSPDVGLLIFDVAKEGYDWGAFANLAALQHPQIYDIREAERVLAWLVDEVGRRNRKEAPQTPLVVVIDEVVELVSDSELATKHLATLARKSRNVDIHLNLATQYPTIKALQDADIKRNLGVVLCGRVNDAGAAVNVLGISDSGAQVLCGRGDFLMKDESGLRRMTVAHFQDRHADMLPRVETVQRGYCNYSCANIRLDQTAERKPLNQLKRKVYPTTKIN